MEEASLILKGLCANVVSFVIGKRCHCVFKGHTRCRKVCLLRLEKKVFLGGGWRDD